VAVILKPNPLWSAEPGIPGKADAYGVIDRIDEEDDKPNEPRTNEKEPNQ
jgi:hypothetical protein